MTDGRKLYDVVNGCLTTRSVDGKLNTRCLFMRRRFMYFERHPHRWSLRHLNQHLRRYHLQHLLHRSHISQAWMWYHLRHFRRYLCLHRWWHACLLRRLHRFLALLRTPNSRRLRYQCKCRKSSTSFIINGHVTNGILAVIRSAPAAHFVRILYDDLYNASNVITAYSYFIINVYVCAI